MSTADDLRRWSDEGLISDEQLEAIAAYEAGRSPSGFGRDVLAYLGAVLVVVACIVVAAEVWPDMTVAGQAILAGSGTLALTAAGVLLARSAHESTVRVGHAALLLGTATTCITVAVIVDGMALDIDIIVVSGFAAATAYATFFYVRLRSWAQHLALFGSITGLMLSAAFEPFDVERPTAGGFAMVLFGLLWASLASGNRLPPQILGEILGLLAAGVGSFIIVAESGPDTATGMAWMTVFMALSGALVWYGVMRGRVAVIAMGVLGLLIYMPWFVLELLGEGLGAPIALFLAGALLIGIAVGRDRLVRR